ncbi:MAG: class D sortase [Lachnospiraceae bacterium]|nr:class D sortase [Lachnospiraceae bacterium]
MSRRIRRLMAYIYMPLIFTILGYVLVYIAFKPIINIGVSITSMIMAQEIPDFTLDLESIYVEPQDMEQDDEPTGEVPVKKVGLDDVVWPSYGQHYAQISCERIGLEAPIYMGDDDSITRVGVGQYLGSFVPGYGKIILIGGHCTTFFKPLKNVKVGDVFVVKTSYGVYQYSVSKTKVFKADDMKAYDLEQDYEQLILYTCYPFRLLSGSRQQRLFVYADKISGPQLH